jgi:hypothetical protein
MYAGSMFCASLDVSPQGQRIREAEAQWDLQTRSVCKAKYQPFRKSAAKKDGGSESMEEMFGCNAHHEIRRERILKHGSRPGWVDFDKFHGRRWSFGTPSSHKKRRPSPAKAPSSPVGHKQTPIPVEAAMLSKSHKKKNTIIAAPKKSHKKKNPVIVAPISHKKRKPVNAGTPASPRSHKKQKAVPTKASPKSK